MKILSSLILSFVVIIFVVIIVLLSSEWLFPSCWGSQDLGHGIYLIEFDGGPIIVKGSNIRGNTCYGGFPIVPTSEEHYDSLGNFKEYVLKEKHNDLWILIKTSQHGSQINKFYIISKTFSKDSSAEEILNNHIVSFADSISFFNYIKTHKIGINW